MRTNDVVEESRKGLLALVVIERLHAHEILAASIVSAKLLVEKVTAWHHEATHT
eukprot:SAG11_NODE_10613_length_817_cov_0.825905_1_plen_53_part_10